MHPDFAQTLINLGLLYYDRGEYLESEPWLQQSLEIRIEQLENDDPELATSLLSLADLHCKLDDFERAEKEYVNALRILDKALGDLHPYALYARANASIHDVLSNCA